MRRDGDTTRTGPTLYGADGTANRSGHISSFADADTHVTDSLAIAGDTWTPRRNYVSLRE